MKRPLSQEKALLRSQVLEMRDQLAFELRQKKSSVACAKLAHVLDQIIEGAAEGVHTPITVCVYAAMRNELALDAFIEYAYAQGVRVCFPCMTEVASAKDPQSSRSTMVMREVSFRHYSSKEVPFLNKPLVSFTTNDPLLQDFPPVDPQDFDLIVVPVVAFDAKNNRLGYGGGNYDRFLSHVSKSAQIVGVAFAEQYLEHVPTDSYDVPLPEIITDTL